MEKLNLLLHKISHNYVLLAIGAVLFFAIKAVIGYLTYRHYDSKLESIQRKLDEWSAGRPRR